MVTLTWGGMGGLGAGVKQMVLRVGYEGESTDLTEINCWEREKAGMVPKFLVWGYWVDGN